MKTVNIGMYLVFYNFIIGVLVMVASEKLGTYSGQLAGSHRVQATRMGRLVAFTFGACIAVLMAGIYLTYYILKLY